ncbi:dTDP-glucose 4,6-dehydratase 2 [Marinomonas spartinae]|uniref:NAD-dependent epimerase n=1 Tax=Marinomonas spartinae TaxID=1792290 RepID=UPI000808D3F4|nr:NAD-dependent epimerase [Marinomonas spartinae]SBS40061.1 dTDP-glucose 4,6-dehydratase 2 [Marinomonas spartinae]
MKILVTGAAGFIGHGLIKSLLLRGDDVIGIDNLNDYYDPDLKQARLKDIEDFQATQKLKNTLHFIRMDIADRDNIAALFSQEQFDVVINLAAQAGVRFSIENPQVYIDSNLVGFANILEGCRHNKVKHLVYASSSSVYGMNTKQPFSTEDRVDYPISLYAATKKSNELMAHSYSHLYNIPTTGLRFFTVYGPWGRPDMAAYKFVKAILNGSPIDVYNHGDMQRDFTYIDDIVDGIVRVIDTIPQPMENSETKAKAPYKLFNIGNHNPITLRRFISAIEKACGKKAMENLLPMQAGDAPITYADIDELTQVTGFMPKTAIEPGMQAFVDWYQDFYNLGNTNDVGYTRRKCISV